jgi:chemotaxis protein CheZ
MQAPVRNLKERYGAILVALGLAAEADDVAQFNQQIELLLAERQQSLFAELRALTSDLESALSRFRLDARLIELVENEVPDAHQRLDHVLKLTDEAAHRTIDLVERSGPLAERTAKEAQQMLPLWQAFMARIAHEESAQAGMRDCRETLERLERFLGAARGDMEQVRGNLAEVLMAQGYQDLSGQIIRGVMKLVGELEVALNNLVRLCAGVNPAVAAPVAQRSQGFGPVIPGIDQGNVVSGQDDVDALLSGLA